MASETANLSCETKLGQPLAELAHDIRNALQAVRVNLYSLRLADQGDVCLSSCERQLLIAEADREIELVDRMLSRFVDSAPPPAARRPGTRLVEPLPGAR